MTSKSQEQKWQAESDADTMARYQEIISDKARMSRAVKAAKERATDLTKRANAMKSAASATYKNGGRITKRASGRKK